ncbi:MAG: hypothetical protein HDR48_00130 [Bacteroides sp.]|nr:hypothetical protein [Bacteroides sp.]
MTIHDLIAQFNQDDIDLIRDDVPGRTLVVFQKAQYISECDAPILQFIAIYDKFTKNVKAIKIYGLNMLKTLKHIQENPIVFHCDVWHYVEDIRASAQSITLFVV